MRSNARRLHGETVSMTDDEHRDWPIGEIRTVGWLPHGSEVPKGWERIAHDRSHHSKYSNLIGAVPPAQSQACDEGRK